jgi:hypothetical protein
VGGGAGKKKERKELMNNLEKISMGFVGSKE